MALQAYIELKKPSLADPPRLSILKSKFNRVAILLNGFDRILSEEQINDSLTQLKYYQQEMDTYDKF
jgi:hypothetical protein